MCRSLRLRKSRSTTPKVRTWQNHGTRRLQHPPRRPRPPPKRLPMSRRPRRLPKRMLVKKKLPETIQGATKRRRQVAMQTLVTLRLTPKLK